MAKILKGNASHRKWFRLNAASFIFALPPHKHILVFPLEVSICLLYTLHISHPESRIPALPSLGVYWGSHSQAEKTFDNVSCMGQEGLVGASDRQSFELPEESHFPSCFPLARDHFSFSSSYPYCLVLGLTHGRYQ